MERERGRERERERERVAEGAETHRLRTMRQPQPRRVKTPLTTAGPS